MSQTDDPSRRPDEPRGEVVLLAALLAVLVSTLFHSLGGWAAHLSLLALVAAAYGIVAWHGARRTPPRR